MVGYILIMLMNSVGSIIQISHPESLQSFGLFNKMLFFLLPLVLMYLLYNFELVFAGLSGRQVSRIRRTSVGIMAAVFLLFHLLFWVFKESLPFFLPAIVMIFIQIIFFLMIFMILVEFGRAIKVIEKSWRVWLKGIFICEMVYFVVLLGMIVLDVAGVLHHNLFMVISSFMSMIINPLLMYLFVKYHHIKLDIGSDRSNEIFELYEITEREKEIIALVCKGKTNKEVAEILFLSPLTVRDHLSNIYRKTNVNNRMKLANIFSHSSFL